jgi:hypothetical protein
MRRLAAVVIAVASLAGLNACSGTNIKAADAYKIGCPAVDSAVAGGQVAGKATVAGLKKLSGSGQLDPEPKKWVDATISLLDSKDPKSAPDSTKKLIIDGCAKHGYALRNLS